MIRTPYFSLAASIAFAAATYHRVSMVRVGGIWITKVMA